MQLFHLLTISASLLASVGAVPVSAPSTADGKELDDAGYAGTHAAAATAVDVQDSVGNRSPNGNTAGAKASSSPAAAKGSKTGTGAKASSVAAAASTTEADPRFDKAAASAAEKSAAAAASSQAANPIAVKVASLITASTATQKLDILSNDDDWKFDFNTEPAGANGQGGTIVTANMASFPPTQMTGSSMAIGVMSPCGFATPHSHPRANELNLVIQGKIISAMTLENGARVINQTLDTNQMTVFPQGAMHMEFNPTCSNATFVAAFTNADAGVQQSANAFTNFGDEVIQATMAGSVTVNGKDVDVFKKTIPVNMALGVESCLKVCGLAKRSMEESRQVLKRGLTPRTVPAVRAEGPTDAEEAK